MKRFGPLLLLFLFVPALAGWSLKETEELSFIGGGGIYDNRQICPDNEYVVGFTGRSGLWVDRLTLICAPLLPGGAVGKAHTLDASFGGFGGSPAGDSICKGGIVADGHYWHIDERYIWRVTGYCRDPVTQADRGQVHLLSSGSTRFPPIESFCSTGKAMVGMRSRWGEHVNAIAFICAPIKIPEKPFADTKTVGMIFCHGKGGMQIVPGPTKLTQGITFRAAAQSSQAAIPDEGECAWSDRPIGANEPNKMVAQITTDTKPIFDIVGQGGIFLVSVGIEGDSFRVTKVESANVGFEPGCPFGQVRFNGKCQVLEVLPGTNTGTGGGFIQMFPQSAGASPAPQAGAGIVAAPGAPAAGGAIMGTCGLSGMATVTIADPALTTLNVRDQPEGTVLTTIPKNVPVTVVGACGSTLGAGLAAPKVIPGWCAISSPVSGCVKEEFLTAGMPAQGGLPPGGAGIVANPPPMQQQQPVPQPQMQVPPAAMTAPSAAVGGGQMAQLTQGANVRNEPSGNAKDKNGNNNVLGSLPGGTTLTVLDCNNSWCRISHPQFPSGGWVSRKFVQMTGVSVTVQVVTPPPIVVAPQPTPAPGLPQDGGGLTASTCGLSGTATIMIADPSLTTLNVRDRPNGPTILTTLPKNSQVNVVGACGKQIAAGIVAGPVGTVVPGWCAISAPVTGCVKEEFLVAGIPAAAQAGAAPGTAGLVAAKPTFTGTWAAEAQGYSYTFTLNQSGGSVTGNYTGTDGSSGQLSGNVSGNVLRFGWQQNDDVQGAGKFTMSDDGSRFDGSYTLGNNPDVAEGSWNGRRQ